MFRTTTSDGRQTTIEGLMEEYPEIVAYDESGWNIDPQDMIDNPEVVANAGYGDRASRRILFWRNEAESENDPGLRSVAEARWEE